MRHRRDTKGALHIALAFPLTQAHLQTLTQGIVAYAKSQTRWILTTGGEAGALSIEQLKGWRGDGIIAALISPSEAQTARRYMRAGVPVVTIAGALMHPGVPRVSVANVEVGRLAAEHLMACGFRRFACYSLRGVAYSLDRQRGFVRRLEEAGFSCALHFSPGTYGRRRPWQEDVTGLQGWLATLTPPVGIFAVNDFRARLIIDACELQGLKLPAQVGIVGVDNDKVICEFSEPGISSIECDWYRVGFEAARTLHDMLQEQTPAGELQVKPREVVRRTSTTVTVTEDPRLLKVVTFIREHLGEVFGVEKLLQISDVSRRKLEQIFQDELHMTPYHYLCLKRVEHAKALLQAQPPLKLKQVGRMCGFRDGRRFRLVFMRMEGPSPAAYREGWGKARLGQGAATGQALA